MSSRLKDHINSQYFEAANRLRSLYDRRKIVVYVESYDDVLFWRQVLGRFENNTRYFEIMLPVRGSYLERGKKAAIANMLSGVGRDMIACVDADYDYLIQGATETSKLINENPYIFHTYVYAIENYQCYAPGLHDACVMVTLNDHNIFDFEKYLFDYSQAIWPLFVWNIWFYRGSHYMDFTITDFNKIIEPGYFRINHPEEMINDMRRKIERKLRRLNKDYPQFLDQKDALINDLNRLGVRSDNTYLFVQGHHLFDKVVCPVVFKVSERLEQEQEEEIREQSVHAMQETTEMSSYKHSIENVTQMMKKNMVYQYSEPFQHLLKDIENYLANK
ncbi:MAG: DUF4435 domain-containing protein [Prevotella sp.]|jgi:hypothetical protein|nr:DUF4435 domain-containing protein [Prevotella sp.]MCH4183278.1 DUF4435 domain-containing protein [Prevotella sp.]MCH4213102.1 DUF4435 domain-containing protein [Prevotella sp.]MCH4242341.1 DUF4435 domain-containing protein [Prevotella sp.]